MSKRASRSVPGTEAVWYIEPVGGYSNYSIRSKLQGDEESSCCEGERCADNKRRDFWQIPFHKVDGFEESRGKDKNLHFALWCKNEPGSPIELRKSDKSYTQRNLGLFPHRKSPLRHSLGTGTGKPVNVPRKLQRPKE